MIALLRKHGEFKQIALRKSLHFSLCTLACQNLKSLNDVFLVSCELKGIKNKVEHCKQPGGVVCGTRKLK